MFKGHKIFWGALLLGLFLWTIDAFIDYSFSLGNTFLDHFILRLKPGTVFKRLALFSFFIFLAVGFSRVFISRRQAERNTAEAERKYRLLLENIQEAIIVIEENMIRFANRRALEIFEFSEKEFLTRAFNDFVHPEDQEVEKLNYQQIIKGEKEPSPWSVRAISKKGKVVWIELKANPFLWKGRPAVLYCLKDISASKAAEELREQRGALQKLVAEISSRFISLPFGEMEEEIKNSLGALRKLFPIDYISLSLLDAEGTKIEHSYEGTPLGTGISKPISSSFPLPLSPWLKNKLMKSEIVNLPRIANLPQEAQVEKEAWQNQGCQSLLAIPLMLGDNLIGLLTLISQSKEVTWEEEDINLFKIIAEILASVIARKRNEEALQKIQESFQWLAQESASIAEIGRIVSSTLHIEEVYEAFAAEAHKLISFDRLAIATVNQGEGTFTISYVAGPQIVGRQIGEVLPLKGSAIEEVIRTHSGIVIGEENRELLTAKFPALLPIMEVGYRSMIMVPLISKKEIIGVLNLQSTKANAYSQMDLKFMERIATQISGAIANAQLYSRQKQTEEALRTSEKRYRLLVENAPLGILSADRQGQIIDINPTLAAMLDSPPPELNIFTCPSFQKAGIAENFRLCLQTGKGGVLETPYPTKNGEEIFFRYHLTPMIGEEGQIIGGQAIMEDISEKKRLESQLIHAQKMEAIGTLAGGIAHDFNNILSAIIGYTELACFELSPDSNAALNLQAALKASHRAKELVKQILTFSRHSDQGKKPIQISPLIKETLKLLRASLPSTIEIRTQIDKYEGIIEANPTQIHQVLMNLCANSAHAMRNKGGVLEISLQTIKVDDQNLSQFPALTPGLYAHLSVKDDGEGMPAEILGKIFDPYFTTKKVGEGTGLGLAVVHGIVKNHGGAISAKSELGKGSVFNLFFPLLGESAETGDPPALEFLPLGERERILLVDDEQALVELGKKMLEHLGYEVFPRTSSIEALELFRHQPEQFHLVITDMTMPNMTGEKLAQELIKIRPDIPIILCTGYSEKISEAKAKVLGIREFIMKPLDMNELARTIRRVLKHENRKEASPNYALR